MDFSSDRGSSQLLCFRKEREKHIGMLDRSEVTGALSGSLKIGLVRSVMYLTLSREERLAEFRDMVISFELALRDDESRRRSRHAGFVGRPSELLQETLSPDRPVQLGLDFWTLGPSSRTTATENRSKPLPWQDQGRLRTASVPFYRLLQSKR